jgi:DNA recombination protein RmuC
MPYLSLIVGLVLLGTLAAVYFALSKHIRDLTEAQKDNSLAQLLNQNINATREELGGRLNKAGEHFAGMKLEIQAMKDIGRNIEELRGVFMNSKLRGNFGEQVLNDMLSNNFPREQFELQHRFKDGQVVDAVIRTKDGLIPIDSKFPVDNFRKMHGAATEESRALEHREFGNAVKKHLNDIAKKYILPGEGTIDFAIMYVPSEAVYYEIVSGPEELTDLARRLRVMIASPNTFSYLLHILRLGHERIRIEENVQRIWELLSGYHQETQKFGEQLEVLAKHITNAKNNMDTVHASYDRLASKIDQIRHLK